MVKMFTLFALTETGAIVRISTSHLERTPLHVENSEGSARANSIHVTRLGVSVLECRLTPSGSALDPMLPQLIAPLDAGDSESAPATPLDSMLKEQKPVSTGLSGLLGNSRPAKSLVSERFSHFIIEDDAALAGWKTWLAGKGITNTRAERVWTDGQAFETTFQGIQGFQQTVATGLFAQTNTRWMMWIDFANRDKLTAAVKQDWGFDDKKSDDVAGRMMGLYPEGIWGLGSGTNVSLLYAEDCLRVGSEWREEPLPNWSEADLLKGQSGTSGILGAALAGLAAQPGAATPGYHEAFGYKQEEALLRHTVRDEVQRFRDNGWHTAANFLERFLKKSAEAYHCDTTDQAEVLDHSKAAFPTLLKQATTSNWRVVPSNYGEGVTVSVYDVTLTPSNLNGPNARFNHPLWGVYGPQEFDDINMFYAYFGVNISGTGTCTVTDLPSADGLSILRTQEIEMAFTFRDGFTFVTSGKDSRLRNLYPPYNACNTLQTAARLDARGMRWEFARRPLCQQIRRIRVDRL